MVSNLHSAVSERQSFRLSTHPGYSHAIEEVGAARPNMCSSAVTLFIPKDAVREQAANRTGEKCGGSIGNSFNVTGTGSG